MDSMLLRLLFTIIGENQPTLLSSGSSVIAALDRLECIYGAVFYEIFKTIIVDNGSEFADADGIERSARRKDAKRTTVYYCHAYSSCERGTNENINRMIWLQFPKGTDFDKVTAAEVKCVETWLNDNPREILSLCPRRRLSR